MKIAVIIEQIQDIDLADAGKNRQDDRSETSSLLDPYSEYAFNTAIGIKKDEDTVCSVAVGGMHSKDALTECLKKGSDEAFLLADDAFVGGDAFAKARTLSAFVSKYISDYDLIICGERNSDERTAQLPAMLASMLEADQFYYVEDLTYSDGWKVTQNYGNERRTCAADSGSVVSLLKGDIQHIPLKEICDKNVKVLNRIDLGLGTYSVGRKGSRTKTIGSIAEAES